MGNDDEPPRINEAEEFRRADFYIHVFVGRIRQLFASQADRCVNCQNNGWRSLCSLLYVANE